MKFSKTLVAALVLTVLSGMGSSLLALEKLKITRENGYFGGSGGEFSVVGLGSAQLPGSGYVPGENGTSLSAGSFQTFCVEYQVHVSPGSDYWYSISDEVQFANDHGLGYVALGTDWLYDQFARGILSGYEYEKGTDRAASAIALQNAIWFIQGQIADAGTGAGFVVIAEGAVGASELNSQSNGMYGTRALNLWSQDNPTRPYDVQTQLIRVPDGGTTVALLGIAICSLAFVARRRKA